MSLSNLFKSKLSGNIFWLALAEIAGRGSIILGSIYLARVLGVESFGVFMLAQMTVFYLWFAVDLGTTMYGIREVAKSKKNIQDITNPLLTIRFLFGILIFSILLIVVSLFIDSEKQSIFATCGLYLLIYALYPEWIVKGLEGFKYLAISSIIYAVLFIVSMLLFVKGPEDLAIVGIVWAMPYLGASLFLYITLKNRYKFSYRPNFDMDIWRNKLTHSIYFTFSGLFILVNHYAPIFILALFYSNTEVGLFSAPFRLIVVLESMGFILLMAFFPSMSTQYKNNFLLFYKQQKQMNLMMLTIGLSTAIVCFFWAQPIIMLLFGEAYQASIHTFIVLVWLLPLYFIRNAYGIILQAIGLQKKHYLASLFGAIASLGFGLLLIPYMGRMGTAWALVLAEFVFTGMMYFYFRKFIQKKFE